MNKSYQKNHKEVLFCSPGKDYWDSQWEKLPPVSRYEGPVFELHPLLSPFLSRKSGGEAIEIGCVPGNYMIYLNKEFGYKVSGIDSSDRLDYVKSNLEYNGIADFELFQSDFFQFDPKKKYDLVFSLGFAEHFDDYEGVIKKHAELVKNGGLAVIAIPNLTHIHHVLCGCFQPQIFKSHNLRLMDKNVFKKTLLNAGFEILHCDYFKTFRPTYRLPYFLDFASRSIQKTLRFLKLDNIGNKYASPYLVSISRKRL